MTTVTAATVADKVVDKPELYLAKQAVDIVKAKLQPALPQEAKQCR